MWRVLLTLNKVKIDLEKSFFCGDAAGRKHDFADTDLLFAKNVGIPFKLP
jgi:bifunctional polynucleotide phosphatase/kinase